jgi:hypothetical protein
MLPYIVGFMVGGFVGFFVCSVLHANRFDESNDLIHAKRQGQQKTTFPLTDADGVLVYADRRMQLDRRLHTIKTLP